MFQCRGCNPSSRDQNGRDAALTILKTADFVEEREPSTKTRQRGKPDMIHVYHDPTGKPYHRVYRRGSGPDKDVWQDAGYEGSFYPYRVEQLPDRSDVPIIIVEGERCADHLVRLEYAAVTWSGIWGQRHPDEECGGESRLAALREAGDFSKADALLSAIEARADVAVARAAEAAFRRGQIAATQIRWGEAAAHFDKAARLDPVYDHLKQAGSFAWRSGRYAIALLLDLSRREYGERSPKTGTALGSLANLLKDTGRYEEAEPLFRQALEIGRETLGEGHPDYAIRLNNELYPKVGDGMR